MQDWCVARPVAAVQAEPLSPPHSDHSLDQLDTHNDKPMDLSSGGGVAAGLTQLFNRNALCVTEGNMPISEHPLFNARLAELVKQQHRESEERERESKRKWEERDDNNEEEGEEENCPPAEPIPAESGATARHLIRAGWEGAGGGDRVSPGLPGSPAGSSSGSESGPGERREEKRRRLDLLLTKKFDRAAGGGVETMDNILSTPPPSERETSPAGSDRRPSTDSTGEPKPNRRKQAQPSRPVSPPQPSLSLRPNSDLFPPIATSTPRRKGEQTGSAGSTQVPNSVPVNKPSRNSEEKENKEDIKSDLLKMQMNSGLLGGLAGASGPLPPPEMLKALQYNPLLYYSYYAQMLSALQAQQKLLELNSSPAAASPPPPVNNNNNNNNSIKDLLSPLKMASSLSTLKDSNQDPRLLFNPYHPPHSNSPASSLSPGGYKVDEEPRKRAPRALTGRYVRTGTAASPRVLQILRKKIEDRLKLKELLGENSHLYFGQTKHNSPYKNSPSQKNKKKF